MDQPFIVPNQSIEQTQNVSDSLISNPRESSMSLSVASKPVDSQLSTPASEPELLFVRPKKRKSATSEFIPWHKEILEGSERLRDIRCLSKLRDLMC